MQHYGIAIGKFRALRGGCPSLKSDVDDARDFPLSGTDAETAAYLQTVNTIKLGISTCV